VRVPADQQERDRVPSAVRLPQQHRTEVPTSRWWMARQRAGVEAGQGAAGE